MGGSSFNREGPEERGSAKKMELRVKPLTPESLQHILGFDGSNSSR